MLRKPIVINNFQQGIADSPHLGFQDMRDVDIDSVTGVAKCANKPVTQNTFSTTAASNDYIRAIAIDTTVGSGGGSTLGDLYLAYKGDVYRGTGGGGTWTQEAGNSAGASVCLDAVFFKGHVFFFFSNLVDVYDISGDSWDTDWETITPADATHMPALASTDGKLYYGNGSDLASVEVVTEPVNFGDGGTTYTHTAVALDLPDEFTITSIVDFGRWLAIGTRIQVNSNQFNSAYIFLWDRVSSTFELPIIVQGDGIEQLLTVNNNLYFTVRDRFPVLYVTNGTNVQKLKEFRNIAFATSGGEDIGSTSAVMWHKAIMEYKKKIYIGVSQKTQNDNSHPMGIYSYDIETGTLNCENIVIEGSNPDGSGSNFVSITALFPRVTNDYIYAVATGTTGGSITVAVNRISNLKRVTSYSARIDSPMYRIGSAKDKVTLEEFEIILAKELATDEGVKLSYRLNLTDSYTAFWTFDNATYGALSSGHKEFTIPDVETIQFRIELTTGSDSNTSPELLEVRIQ